MNAVKNTAARVINLCLACRLQLIPEPPLNDEQIECVAETILAAIDYAAALDQDRRPQRSRTITGKITMFPVSTKSLSRCSKIQYLTSLLCHLFY